MRHVEPRDDSPEGFIESLHDLANARFEQDFIENPMLNDFANNTADIVVAGFLDSMNLDRDVIYADTDSGLSFAVKKLIFVFADPADYGTIPMLDFGVVLTSMYYGAEQNIDSLAAMINRYANFCRAYIDQAQEADPVSWQLLNISQRFWYTHGYVSGVLRQGDTNETVQI